MQTYIVKEHDSLWKIARLHGTTVAALAALNHLKGEQLHLIHRDQVLLLPNDDADEVADTKLSIKFRALDFSSVTPKKVKVAHDDKEEIHVVSGPGELFLYIRDHARGLKIWIEDLDQKMDNVFSSERVPIGNWVLAVDSRAVKADGSLQKKKGSANSTTEEVKQAVTHNAQLTSGATVQQQTRAEAGAPTHGLATIYTEANLRLLPGNEKYRKLIITAAKKYELTPQSLAALIDAEVGGVWDEKANHENSGLAQGLAQFFEPAWDAVYKLDTSLLHADCQKMSASSRLAKRLEAKYAIDGAAAYASLNLKNFEKESKLPASTLPAADKAKLAYLLHHDGLTGALRLFGLREQLSEEDITDKLRKQIGKDNVKKLNSLLKQYKNSGAAAYQGWLFDYIDAKVNVANFIVKEDKDFSEPARGMAEIVLSLNSSAKIQVPVPKPKKEASAPSAKSKTPPTELKAAQAPPAPASSSNEAKWHNPLSICTLRTAHLPSKTGAKFGWTRNGGTKCHQGIDLVAVPGTPIFAVANGIVYSTPAKSPTYAYGNTLVLVVGLADLPEPQATEFKKVNPGATSIGFFYAHLSELPSESPKNVYAGDVIGKSGASGNAHGMNTVEQGAHLHFEVRLKARTLSAGLTNRADPLPFIENCTNI
ncbi:peptidoglycan DD-metalloendopeptidase family protein [Rugamonas rivuli]|uniref:Peptidoglycan DD-metalloendopeptidase family protein n=1 Tax=Rugamonas rivuli TaxID=2743358 RepID=A0A843S7E6_9BURK|nr:peptidoglycan DD-metalloendopeptidase family protein [Rugamonas rivuli]MQA18140.1 peptidoglycan DD-metalloendopeptidase family protein [Rugamonas rivuli]